MSGAIGIRQRTTRACAALFCLLALAACQSLSLGGVATDHGGATRARAGIPF
jgi:hypothetical protein